MKEGVGLGINKASTEEMTPKKPSDDVKKESVMKMETLSVPVRSIRLVPGKSFGFAELKDGRSAFVAPPLMRGLDGQISPHAIVEMADKGPRIVRFLDKPEIRFLWSEKAEARIIELTPELAKVWFLESHAKSQDVGYNIPHGEFKTLFEVGIRESHNTNENSFFPNWRDKYFIPACRLEVQLHVPELLEEWEEELENKAHARADRTQNPPRPWWYGMAPEDTKATLDLTYEMYANDMDELKIHNKERHLEYLANEKKRQLEGVTKGLALAGIADLVTPEEVLKSWPNAGDYFTEVVHNGELGASKWFRERREHLAQILFDKACEAAKIPATYQKWAGYYPDTSSYRDADGDWQTVDHGTSHVEYHTTPLEWAVEAVERIRASDKAVGFHADLSALVDTEVKQQQEALHSEVVKKERRSIADWFRRARKEPRSWGKWQNPPENISDPSLAEKASTLFTKIKERTLKKEGLKDQEAKKAAQNEAEEQSLLSIASVRTNWRNMLQLVPGTRAYRRLNLNPDAQDLLEKIREAQHKAGQLRQEREWLNAEVEAEVKRKLEEVEEKRKKDATDKFLSKGAWDSLDKLKL